MQNARAAFCELLASELCSANTVCIVHQLTSSVKIIRATPHADDEAELVDALVHGWCAFEGASEEVWSSFGDERQEVEESTGSALEVCPPLPHGCLGRAFDAPRWSRAFGRPSRPIAFAISAQTLAAHRAFGRRSLLMQGPRHLQQCLTFPR